MADNQHHDERNEFCGRTRREFLWQTGGGFTGLALTAMLTQDGFLGAQAQAAEGCRTDARSPRLSAVLESFHVA